MSFAGRRMEDGPSPRDASLIVNAIESAFRRLQRALYPLQHAYDRELCRVYGYGWNKPADGPEPLRERRAEWTAALECFHRETTPEALAAALADGIRRDDEEARQRMAALSARPDLDHEARRGERQREEPGEERQPPDLHRFRVGGEDVDQNADDGQHERDPGDHHAGKVGP